MAEITGMTAAAMQAIANSIVNSAYISTSGHLILETVGGPTIDAGPAIGPTGATGPTGPQGLAGVGPTGMMAMWPAAIAPVGWLICSGQAISRTTYATLFSVIGTVYGAGDGATTFNIPNMQQQFPRQDTGNLGASAGANNHVHSISDHTHQIDGGSSPAVAHVTIQTGAAPDLFMERLSGITAWTPGMQGDVTPETSPTGTQSTGAKVTGVTQNGGVTAVNSTNALPPYLNVNFIIKT